MHEPFERENKVEHYKQSDALEQFTQLIEQFAHDLID